MNTEKYSYGNATHVYDIPDGVLTDLANSVAMLRAMSQHDPRIDRMGQINLDLAAEHMQAILDLANEQHPVQDLVVRIEVLS